MDWPAGQALQYKAPVVTPDPSESELELAVKCPAAHVMQDNCPEPPWYLPAGQLPHDVDPTDDVYWPAPHVSQY